MARIDITWSIGDNYKHVFGMLWGMGGGHCYSIFHMLYHSVCVCVRVCVCVCVCVCVRTCFHFSI